MEVDQQYPPLLLKCSGTITKLILIPIPWPSITARSDADVAQCYPKDSQGFVCGEKKKKKSFSASKTPSSQTPPEKDLSSVKETLCCASLFPGCVMGKAEQGVSVSVTFQSRVSVLCLSPISCHRAIAGWFASMAVSLPAWLMALFHGAHWGLQWISCGAWLASPPLVAGLSHLLLAPKYLRALAGNQESTGRAPASGTVRDKASNKLTRVMCKSRRRALGCTNKQRVILICPQQKQKNKGHQCRHKVKSEPTCYFTRSAAA